MRINLKEVEIMGVRAIRPSLKLTGLKPGLNVVFAANGAGKSTMALGCAIALGFDQKRLLTDASQRIVADLWVGEEERRVEVTSGGGGLTNPGALAGLCRFELTDLIKEGWEENFIKAFLVPLIGVGFTTQPKRGQERPPDSKELQKLVAEMDRQKSVAEALAIEEANLKSLTDRKAAADASGRQADLLAEWLRRLDIEEEIQRLQAEISSLATAHPGLEKQIGRSVQELQNALATWRSARSQFEKAEAALKSWTGEWRSLGPENMRRLDRLREDEIRLEADLKSAQKDHREAEAAFESASERLRSLLQAEEEPTLLSAADLDRWEDWSRALEKHRLDLLEKSAYEMARDNIPAAEAPKDDAKRIQDALKKWIESEPKLGPDHRPWILVGLTLVGVLLSAILPEMWMKLGAGVIVVVLSGAVVLFLAPKMDSSERETAASSLSSPPKSPSEALEEWRRLETGLLRAELDKEVRQRLDALASRPVTEHSVPEWFAGESPSRSAIVKMLSDAVLLKAKADGLAERVKSLSADTDQVRSQGSQLVAGSGVSLEDHSLSEILVNITKWEEDAQSLRDREESLAQQQRSLDTLIESFGFPQETPLDDLVLLAQERQRHAKTLAELKEDLRDKTAELKNIRVNEGLVQQEMGGGLFAPVDRESVSARIASLKELQATADALEKELQSIKDRVRDAEKSDQGARIEQAIAKEWRAYEQSVEDKKKVQVEGVLDAYLRRLVKEDLAPSVIRRANEMLDRFSGKRYRILLSEGVERGGNPFVVQDDHLRGEPYTLAKLSTGSKVHVSLALRLAMLEENEAKQGVKLPLVLDEILGVSDDLARKEIAEAVKLVAEERQVILFSNHGGDVQFLDCPVLGLNGATQERVEVDSEVYVPVLEPLQFEGEFDRGLPLDKQEKFHRMATSLGIASALEEVLNELNQTLPLLTDRMILETQKGATAAKFCEEARVVGGRRRFFWAPYPSDNDKEPAAVKKLREGGLDAPLPTLQELRDRLRQAAEAGTSDEAIDWAARVIERSL